MCFKTTRSLPDHFWCPKNDLVVCQAYPPFICLQNITKYYVQSLFHLGQVLGTFIARGKTKKVSGQLGLLLNVEHSLKSDAIQFVVCNNPQFMQRAAVSYLTARCPMTKPGKTCIIFCQAIDAILEHLWWLSWVYIYGEKFGP